MVIFIFFIIILNNCYGKQKRHFKFLAICRTCVPFKHNLNIYYLKRRPCYNTVTCAAILNLTLNLLFE